MSYLLIKSLHICAIILWIAGMVLQSLLLQLTRSWSTPPNPAELNVLQKLRLWDRRVTAPAMLTAWITGLFLATQGHWFGNRWLFVKLAIVVALAALHGMLAGQLRRRLEAQPSQAARAFNFTLASLFVMTAGIVLLVTVKPF